MEEKQKGNILTIRVYEDNKGIGKNIKLHHHYTNTSVPSKFLREGRMQRLMSEPLKPVRDEDGLVLHVNNIQQDKVVFCFEAKQESVDKFAVKAIENRASAFFSFVKPTLKETPQMPTIVVDKQELLACKAFVDSKRCQIQFSIDTTPENFKDPLTSMMESDDDNKSVKVTPQGMNTSVAAQPHDKQTKSVLTSGATKGENIEVAQDIQTFRRIKQLIAKHDHSSITSLSDQYEHCLGFFPSRAQAEIDIVAKLAETGGMAGLILLRKPSFQTRCSMVCVIADIDMGKLTSIAKDSTTAVVECLDQSNHINLAFNISETSQSSANLKRTVPSIETGTDEEPSRKKGLLERFQNFVFRSTFSWSSVLSDEDGWGGKKLQSYEAAMQRLDLISRGDCEDDPVDLAEQVKLRLGHPRCTMRHIVCATRVCLMTGSEGLAASILNLLVAKKLILILRFVRRRDIDVPPTKIREVFNNFFSFVFVQWEDLNRWIENADLARFFSVSIWIELDLLTRDDIDWKTIRCCLGESFFGKFAGELTDKFGILKISRLQVKCCHDLPALQKLLVRGKQKESMFAQDHKCIVLSIEELTMDALEQCQSHPEQMMKEQLIVFSETLRAVDWRHRSYRSGDKGHKLLQAVVTHVQRNRPRDLGIYDEFLNTIEKGHPCFDALYTVLESQLLEHLRTLLRDAQLVEPNTFLDLATSQAGRFLANRRLQDATNSFVFGIIVKRTTHDSLTFLSNLYAAFEAKHRVEFGKKLARDSLESIRPTHQDKSDYYKGICGAFSQDPLLFKDISRDFADEMCRTVLPTGEKHTFDPSLLNELLITLEQGCKGPVQNALHQRLLSISEIGMYNVNSIIDFIVEAEDANSFGETLRGLSFRKLDEVLNRWSPTKLHTILHQGEDVLRKLFRIFHVFSDGVVDHHSMLIQKIVKDFARDFEQDCLSLQDMLNFSSSFSSPCCQLLGSHCGVSLPGAVIVQEKISDMENRTTEIMKSLGRHSDGNTSIKVVLQGYNCTPKPNTPLGKLLDDYSFLFENEGRKSSSYGGTTRNDNVKLFSLKKVRDDQTWAETFRSQNEALLSICDYFLSKPSVLFRNELSHLVKSHIEIAELDLGVRAALKSISRLFGPKTTFQDVDKATKIVSSATVPLDDELATIVQCVGLDLEEKDIERFKVVGLMSSFDKPLQQFVRFFPQFKFSVATNDAKFRDVTRFADELKNGTYLSRDADECMALAQGMLRTLLVQREGSARMELDDREIFRRGESLLLPCVNVVSELSLNSDILSFVREMKWVGELGLQRFYSEHENVTNMLLGNSASFEMTVLDTLEPTVRIVSLILSLISVDDISDIVSQVVSKCTDQVKRLGGEAHSDEIRQIHGYLSEIREWFTEGMDESAGVFSRFESILQGGRATLQTTGAFGARSQLCLRFRHKQKKIELKGTDLSWFVQQVGLLQNEENEISKSIARFLDVFHIVNKAANNLLLVSSIGLEIDIETFSFQFGTDDFRHAQHLLSTSESMSKDLDDRLASIWRHFPCSTLYSTRELHNLFIDLSNNNLQHFPWQMCLRLRSLNDTGSPDFMRTVFNAAEQGIREQNSSGWLLVAARFVESVHRSLEDPIIEQVDSSHRRPSSITLHTMSVEEQQQPRATFSITRLIYNVQLPREFEIIDASRGCSQVDLDAFLQRAQRFSNYTFTIFNVDQLDSFLAEKLVRFISKAAVAYSGIKLHCVQFQPSLLHEGHWIDGRTWDIDSLEVALRAKCGSPEEWEDKLLDRRMIQKIEVVWSGASGTGKTRYIKEQLRHASQTFNATVGTISLHEKTGTAEIVSDMRMKFGSDARADVGKCLVHFSFLYAPERKRGTLSWIESINRFFFDLLVLHVAKDEDSGKSFYLGCNQWEIYVELPASVDADRWLKLNVPVIHNHASIVLPPPDIVIDGETRRVCTYLRAYRDGTIDRKYEESSGRRIAFVMDWSGSMTLAGAPIDIATDNALQLYDSHVNVGDIFSVTMFDHNTTNVVPMQEILNLDHKQQLKAQLDGVRNGGGGGTNMYHALQYVVSQFDARGNDDVETWVVCLTDGASADRPSIGFIDWMRSSPDSFHLIVIGVNLNQQLEASIEELCGKYKGCPSGDFIPSHGSIENLNHAFRAVANRIPVSQTFELLDGEVQDDECRDLLRTYTQKFIPLGDMLTMQFFIQFVYRRAKFFDNNVEFNENVKYEKLGSTLMKTMLNEVERLIGEDQRMEWTAQNQAQLIYDYTESDSPKFRLICTAPDNLHDEVKKSYEKLDLPGFKLPTKRDLECRETLHRYISQAVGVSMVKHENDSLLIPAIVDSGFVLTLDFTMKLLNIHERVVCRLPCIIEGETGVSKTAITKMYAALRNSALHTDARVQTNKALEGIATRLEEIGYEREAETHCKEWIFNLLQDVCKKCIGDESELAGQIHRLLLEKEESRSGVYRPIPLEWKDKTLSQTKQVTRFLHWFDSCSLEQLFFEICVNASLTEAALAQDIEIVQCTARKVKRCGALVVLFFDEINTSSVMGLMKELVVDHSFKGYPIEDNVVVIAACNPSRRKVDKEYEREDDLGKEWASGHYQVVDLPPSMHRLKWSFGALSLKQERDFIFRRIEAKYGNDILPATCREMTEVIASSQETLRVLAENTILAGMRRRNRITVDIEEPAKQQMIVEARDRARSVVSLRDIQRVFGLYDFFGEDLVLAASDSDRLKLAVAVVYYLRLDADSRKKFAEIVFPPRREHFGIEHFTAFQETIQLALNRVTEMSVLPRGIAITEGLQENIFMTLVCLLSRTPLMIVGPPGCSKTLSVNIVADNANGEDSMGDFYRSLARLSLYHYQCSKGSTSKEIADVFAKANNRQEKYDRRKHQCFVFMDEAGLPEEGKESLKVLHYLLEGHMSARPKVGFVAISNHVLDAAKSNRCAMLLRQELDSDEMLRITNGVLFDSQLQKRNLNLHIETNFIGQSDFATKLSKCYTDLVENDTELETFFGLRDYIFFLKALKESSKAEDGQVSLSMKDIVVALERNFNGFSSRQLKIIVTSFLKSILDLPKNEASAIMHGMMREPLEVIEEAIQSMEIQGKSIDRPRYKLIIDRTEDDSILRLLESMGVVDLSKSSLHKLSKLPDDVEIEQLRLVSEVKFAALQGKTVFLSQAETIYEALYDLFNLRFREVRGRSFVNIAVGGVSRRCLVKKSFECVVHVRASQLGSVPAPFLNRFEKYTIGTEDILRTGWSRLGTFSTILKQALAHVQNFVAILGEAAFVGSRINQTIESIFIAFLPQDALLLDCHRGSDFASKAFNSLEACLSWVASILSSVSVEELLFLRLASEATRHLSPALQAALSRLLSGDMDLTSNAILGILGDPNDTSNVRTVCSTLLQVAFSHLATKKLLQITHPESIFLHSSSLPKGVLSEYFSEEHFNLKKLIASKDDCYAGIKKLIVSTRTDTTIRNLPRHSSSQAAEDEDSLRRIRELVCEDIDSVTIEHLASVRSETLLRASVRAWFDDSERGKLVLVFDMCSSHAIDHVNFVRGLVEQQSKVVCPKMVILLLHYPPSVTTEASQYPALFLNHWEHFFLDGMGHASQHITVEESLELACQMERGRVDEDTVRNSIESLSCSLQANADRALTYVASRISHPSGKQETPVSMTRRLTSLLSSRVGNESIAEICCDKFAALWVEKALKTTVDRASRGLKCGKTHVSVSMSVRGTLLDGFDAFMLGITKLMIEEQDVEFLASSLMHGPYVQLFAAILKAFCPAPFHELMMLRNASIERRPQMYLFKFPFFKLVYRRVQDAVEEALKEAKLQLTSFHGDEFIHFVSNKFHELIFEVNPCGVLQTVFKIVESEMVGSDEFLELYIADFVAVRNLGKTNTQLVDWLKGVADEAPLKRDIFSVHLLANEHRDRFETLCSWSWERSPMVAIEKDLDDIGQSYFAAWMSRLERSLLQADGQGKGAWTSSFARLLQRIPSTTFFDHVQRVETRLRVLSFFFILLRCEVPSHIENRGVALWYDCDGGTIQKDVTERGERTSLETFLGLLDPSCSACELAMFMVFEHFFSCVWTSVIPVKNHDLTALLGALLGSSIRDSRKGAILLQQSARAYVRDSKKKGAGLRLHLSQVEQYLVRHVGLQTLSLGSHQFVPRWLIRDTNQGQDKTANCHRRFGVIGGSTAIYSDFVEMVFCFVLAKRATELELVSSETLLLHLLQLIQGDSAEMSPLDRLTVDVEILLYVGKVAYELAKGPSCPALTGTFNKDGVELLETIMETARVRWDDFFFHTIIEAGGEGIAATLLTTGALSSMSFGENWRAGLLNDEAIDALAKAERDLNEAIEDERKKEREMRLCPHCRREFIVHEMNCGQFTCGRDAHAEVGVERVYGCGQTFNIGDAPAYNKQKSSLEPFRRRVRDARNDSEKSHQGALWWESTKSMKLPPFVIQFDCTQMLQYVPRAELNSQLRDDKDHHSTRRLLKRLLEGPDLIGQVDALPDLVELYIWVHSTLKFLVSENEAAEMQLSEVFAEAKMLPRFGSYATKRLVDMYNRASASYMRAIKSCGHTVFWGCEEVEIPFEALGSTPLHLLVSSGDHPSDGSDFLFLIINHIVEQYNNLVTCLNAFGTKTESSGHEDESIRPQHLIRGRFGAIAAHMGMALSRSSITSVVESAWDPSSFMFNVGYLENDLICKLSLNSQRPCILDPLKFLREKFTYREERVSAEESGESGLAGISAVASGSDLLYFANEQDAFLYESCMESFGVSPSNLISCCGNTSLSDLFHGLNYEGLRSMLRGLNNIFSMVKVNEGAQMESLGHAVCEIYRYETRALAVLDRIPLLEGLGLPVMNSSQFQFLLEMSFDEIRDFLALNGYQLASEAHVFADKPACLKEPLSASSIELLDTSLADLLSVRCLGDAIKDTNEFVENVLGYYERLIQEEASKSSSVMLDFLIEFNCCDASESIFKVIPRSVSTRNYVSLRCYLHQKKLSWMYRNTSVAPTDEIDVGDAVNQGPNFVANQWMWVENDEEPTETCVPMDDFRQRRPEELLWFARLHSTKKCDETNLTSLDDNDKMSVDDNAQEQWEPMEEEAITARKASPLNDSCKFTSAALKIQRSYRRHIAVDVGRLDGGKHTIPLEEVIADDISQGEDFSSMKSEAGHLSKISYGSVEGIRRLRLWLGEHRLPESVARILEQLGARDIEDVAMMFECLESELKAELNLLDVMKLKKAVEDYRTMDTGN